MRWWSSVVVMWWSGGDRWLRWWWAGAAHQTTPRRTTGGRHRRRRRQLSFVVVPPTTAQPPAVRSPPQPSLKACIVRQEYTSRRVEDNRCWCFAGVVFPRVCHTTDDSTLSFLREALLRRHSLASSMGRCA